jgi:hypothetical protein
MTTLAELITKWRDDAEFAQVRAGCYTDAGLATARERIRLNRQHADELATALETLAESWLTEAGPGISAEGKVDEPAVAVQWCAGQLVKGVR